MPKAKHLELKEDGEILELRRLRDNVAALSTGARKMASEKLLADVAALADAAKSMQATDYEDPWNGQCMDADPDLETMLKRFSEIEQERVALEARLKENATKAEALVGEEGMLLQKWTSMGLKSMKFQGRTFYVQTEQWLFRKADADKKKALTALRRAKLGQFITESANAQSLRGWLRDRLESGKGIPAGIAKYYEKKARTSLRSRKA